jgi:hypothetical protein
VTTLIYFLELFLGGIHHSISIKSVAGQPMKETIPTYSHSCEHCASCYEVYFMKAVGIPVA